MKPARPRVAVGVVTWNTAALTVGALRSLLDSDQGCDLRLLVRDNASSDGTAEAIAREVPEAELEAGHENLGFARGMNRLIARSEEPWFFALNPDAWPEPGAIGRLVETARSHPKAAVVAPRLEHPDGTLQHSTHPFPSLKVAALVAFRGAGLSRDRGDELLLEGSWRHDRSRRVDWAIGAALLMRREAIEQVGPFSESFFMYVEDLDWCWRARRRGWEVWFDPSAVVRHVGNVSGAQRYGDRRTAAYMVNTYRFYRREHGVGPALAYRALNLTGACLRYLGALRKRDADTARFWRSQVKANLPRHDGVAHSPPTAAPSPAPEERP